ncbi:MAG: transporter [Proteobacteria bacterium]|nr:transporter [Pseudomonadota bacterium]MBU2226178.1 transporter [Pseudomonadota bacterium]MBU2260594.1 transporter [Pseudomonadota bacterium]
MLRHPIKSAVLSAVLMLHSIAWAAHPLITDDTGTQGQGKFQIEVSGQYDSNKETVGGVSTESTGSQVATTLSYGFTENMDIVLGIPYQWGKGKEDGMTVYDEKGIADMTVDLKWRFFEKDGLSLAFKPGVRIPTGNDEKGLGAGRTGYQAFLIGSLDAAPWTFHTNVGYIGNENKTDKEKSIWHASLAATCEIVKDLRLVGNIGIERNRDKAASQNPAFLLGGLIYSVSENFDIDVGAKYGLNAAEIDWSLMAGMAFRF